MLTVHHSPLRPSGNTPFQKTCQEGMGSIITHLTAMHSKWFLNYKENQLSNQCFYGPDKSTRLQHLLSIQKELLFSKQVDD